MLNRLVNLSRINKKLLRPSQIISLVGNTAKAKKTFNYKSKTNLDQIISIMMDNDLKNEISAK